MMTVVDSSFVLALLTAAGTVAAAVAALRTARTSRQELIKRLSYDQQLKQPNLVLSSLDIDHIDRDRVYTKYDHDYKGPVGSYETKFRLTAELTNLGQFPVYVKSISTPQHHQQVELLAVKTEDKYEQRGFSIAPNTSESRSLEISINVPSYQDAEDVILFSFHYGPTAKKMHRLEVKVSASSYTAAAIRHGMLYVEHGDGVDEQLFWLDLMEFWHEEMDEAEL